MTTQPTSELPAPAPVRVQPACSETGKGRCNSCYHWWPGRDYLGSGPRQGFCSVFDKVTKHDHGAKCTVHSEFDESKKLRRVSQEINCPPVCNECGRIHAGKCESPNAEVSDGGHKCRTNLERTAAPAVRSTDWLGREQKDTKQ